MGSRLVPGLHFIGEVVDVTGHLGGHNFQWAWSSGVAAGRQRLRSAPFRQRPQKGVETPMRILFTGGSGKAGKHVVPYLLEQGHRVVNVDLTPLEHPGVDNLTADITRFRPDVQRDVELRQFR
jgi:hypothetical protein